MKKTLNSGMEESSKDEVYYRNWIEEQFEDENNELFLERSLKDKWNEILDSPTKSVELKHILYRLHFNINVKGHSKATPRSRQLYTRFSRIAALLVLPLLILSTYLIYDKFYTPQQFSEIVAPKGEKVKFVLPDGSSGYLNSGSRIRYAYPFQERLVKLEGEGFFDVVHAKNTFTVATTDVKIEVHGTRFNVCAYKEDLDIVTTLEEGSVTVVRDSDGERLTIKPGDQAVFSKASSRLSFSRASDVELFISWKDNLLKFQNASFPEVIKKMERWYDVKIILDDKLKFAQRYTMKIKTESLREMLELMKVTAPMNYEIKEDLVYITYKSEAPMK
ncbi:MAG: FecR domain-containing protein [Prolixibacteraceae bacterium]